MKRFSPTPKPLILLITALLLTGCDKKIINIYDKSILNQKIDCMHLTVFPPSDEIESKIKNLYSFKEECPYELYIQYKNCITCNSNFNIQGKSTQGMPSSYLNMTIKYKGKAQYSYYIDLNANVDEKDLQKGFRQIKEELNLY
ncbi:MAG: hypothetical protein U9N49_01190 [Campylobacterota bacterium]|nr:hypothetical protein [Campylobacterota bacterium]